MQSEGDDREIEIEQVGVSALRYPITIADCSTQPQQTVATLTLSVTLPHHTKGTHMSRFIEVLEGHQGHIDAQSLPDLMYHIRARLGAERAQVEIRFPFFLKRTAPVSGAESLMDYQCSFSASQDERKTDIVVGAAVPVSSVCPCSKAISDYGAHNQRGTLQLVTRAEPQLWLEELIEVAEASGSSPVYPLLKRADERHATMQAYDNPVFVEDMVRNAAVRLRANPGVQWFRIRAENLESIHNHSAFAQVSWTRCHSARTAGNGCGS